MLHPLEKRVSATGALIGRWRLIHGAGWFAILAGLSLVLAGYADYLLRLQDHGLRLILSASLWIGLAWLLWRYLVPALGRGGSLVQIAQRIELRFPVLRDRLASAIAFLGQAESDVLAGSVTLRKAVVAETESLANGLDFREAVDATRVRGVLGGAGAVAVLAAVFILAQPTATLLALSRLANPWGDQRWPLWNHLQLDQGPLKIASGADFEVVASDQNGRLPPTMRIQIRRNQNGRQAVETKPMLIRGELAIFSQTNVTHPFEYRVLGGDDHTLPWRTLEVFKQPQIMDVQVQVRPPAYSRRPAYDTGRIAHVLAGSRIVVHAKLDQPITRATLHGENNAIIPLAVEVAADGLSFTAPAGYAVWQVEKSANYWFEIATEADLPSGRDLRLEIVAVPDAPPAISWETPPDQAFVTARALVPIKCLIKDDLAVQSAQLRYQLLHSSDPAEKTWEVYHAAAGQVEKDAAPAEGDAQTLSRPWDLATIPGLAPGSVLAVRVTAEDYKPQQAATVVRRLTIISDQDLENRVVQKQGAILSQLAEVLRLEREARTQTSSLEIQLREGKQFTAEAVNHLQSTELNQRQVQRLLGDPQDGVETRIQTLLDELSNNHIADRGVGARMQKLLAAVRELNRRELPAIAQALTASLKSARAALESGGANCDDPAKPAVIVDSAKRLDEAARGQEQVVSTLETLLGNLSQWDSFSRLAREISQIHEVQSQLQEQTAALRLQAAASDSAADAEKHRILGKQYAQRQLDLGRRFDKLQTRMEELLTSLRTSDPQAADALADVLEAGRRGAIGGEMRAAAGELDQLQLGEAENAQKRILESLNELLNRLTNRPEQGAAVKLLEQAAGELAELRARQRQLHNQMQTALGGKSKEERARQLQTLRQSQRQVAEEARRLSRKLERLQARRAAESIQKAGQNLAQAEQAADDDQAEQARQESSRAQDLLAEAEQRLARELAQAKQDLVREQLARLEQIIAGLVQREQNVLAETIRLEASRMRPMGTLPSAALATLRGIAAEQRLLAEETAQVSRQFPALSAFVFALDHARQQMLQAAAALDDRQTGEPVQRLERDALVRLQQFLVALQPPQEQPAEPKPNNQPGEKPDDPQAQPETAIRSLAELKLLALLQEAALRRTEQLEAAREKKTRPDMELQQAARELAVEQGKLADMILDLIKANAQPPNENDSPAPGDKAPGDKAPGDKLPPKDDNQKNGAPKLDALDEALLRDLEGKK